MYFLVDSSAKHVDKIVTTVFLCLAVEGIISASTKADLHSTSSMSESTSSSNRPSSNVSLVCCSSLSPTLDLFVSLGVKTNYIPTDVTNESDVL